MRPQAAPMPALLQQVAPRSGDGMGARLIEAAGFPLGFACRGRHFDTETARDAKWPEPR
jgi:hypothetical protein